MTVSFVVALALMGAGWFTGNIVLIVVGSVLAAGTLIQFRSPLALDHFAAVIALGWWFLFIRFPIVFGVPLTAAFISWRWKQRIRRREEIAAADASQAL